MNNIIRNLCYVLFALACMGAGIFMASRNSSPPELKAVQLLPGSKKLTGVDLQSTRDTPIHNEFFLGHWTLVFFGFTSCPDFCPMELQKMGKALRLAGQSSGLQVLFVSVDPERDTQEKLRSYVEFFHPQIVGARGDNKKIAKLAELFGAAYDRSFILDKKLHEISAGMDMPSTAVDNYLVNHSLRIFVVNPKGEYIGSFSPPFDAEIIHSDMNELMK